MKLKLTNTEKWEIINGDPNVPQTLLDDIKKYGIENFDIKILKENARTEIYKMIKDLNMEIYKFKIHCDKLFYFLVDDKKSNAIICCLTKINDKFEKKAIKCDSFEMGLDIFEKLTNIKM